MRIAMPDLRYIVKRYMEGRYEGEAAQKHSWMSTTRGSIARPFFSTSRSARGSSLSLRLCRAGYPASPSWIRQGRTSAAREVLAPGARRTRTTGRVKADRGGDEMTWASKGPFRLPDVAVVLITYNHETFIAESINSVSRRNTREHPCHRLRRLFNRSDTEGHQRDDLGHAAERDRAPDPEGAERRRPQESHRGVGIGERDWKCLHRPPRRRRLLDGCSQACASGQLHGRAPRSTLSFGLATELILCDNAPSSSKVAVIPPSDHPTFGELLCGNFINTCTVVYRSGCCRISPTGSPSVPSVTGRSTSFTPVPVRCTTSTMSWPSIASTS